ncbi:peptidoglycan-binding protein [Thauera sp.]|jgi:peptidoglycan hydrolase-like protein with peptidoglycan-binding domain|uniref:peptidoglycan-binding domain-containing protein n=1 Tax=Thauera sp. TaxID=1905334 RepID=UPI002A365484|nr:peptidoglycan-binding protein [Thauera sp.]MDX9887005.1 peptidoglycan-binding protein [Thauera sp.]
MFDRRNGLPGPFAALVLGLSASFGWSGPLLAQAEAATQLTGSAFQVAQYSNTVLELQRELNQLGFNAGPADGVMGARTRSAIRAYQADNELLVDGQPSASLLSHVRATGQGRTPPPATSTTGASFQMVADIQEALRGSGYTPGRESGRLDDQTRAAIRSYESDHGLLMSGEPSVELLRHMRERANAAPAPAPSALPVDANTLARIQAELRERGYPIPLISGRMDAPTRQAIREYQQGQGVSVTGEPSQALLDALRTGSADTTPELGLSREQRAAAQRALNERGYDAGPPDGVLGPRSRVAIRTFQAANQLGATGTLDAQTMKGLGVAATLAASPPATASSYRVRVRDDFSDGDHTRNPAWRIASGRLEVRNGGLNSVVTPSAARPQDAGRQLIEDLLKQQLGVGRPGQEGAVAAVAYLPIRLAPVFRMTMLVSGSAEPYSHLELGPYRGNGLNHGYRLSQRGDQPLQLVFADERGASVIASARYRLENSVPQRLIWQRDAEGRMTVSRDGEVLIDVVDRKAGEGFDGFSLINAGGEWTLHELVVEDRS